MKKIYKVISQKKRYSEKLFTKQYKIKIMKEQDPLFVK